MTSMREGGAGRVVRAVGLAIGLGATLAVLSVVAIAVPRSALVRGVETAQSVAAGLVRAGALRSSV